MLEYIACGDINLNYLTDIEKNSQLESLLPTYYLTNTLNFPTRITAIDDNFIDIVRRDSYSVCPIIKELIVMHSQ